MKQSKKELCDTIKTSKLTRIGKMNIEYHKTFFLPRFGIAYLFQQKIYCYSTDLNHKESNSRPFHRPGRKLVGEACAGRPRHPELPRPYWPSPEHMPSWPGQAAEEHWWCLLRSGGLGGGQTGEKAHAVAIFYQMAAQNTGISYCPCFVKQWNNLICRHVLT